jgi:hypothetical protein
MQQKKSTSTQSGYVRTFIQHSRSYYANVSPVTVEDEKAVEELLLSVENDTSNYESYIRWYIIGKVPTARLEIYDEAWAMLPELQDLFERLKGLGNSEPQPDDIIKVLLECEFVDKTQEKRPSDELPTFEIAENSNLALEEIQSLDDLELIESLIEKNLFVIVRKLRNASKTSFSSGFFRAYGNIVDAEYQFKTTMRENSNFSWALLKSRE